MLTLAVSGHVNGPPNSRNLLALSDEVVASLLRYCSSRGMPFIIVMVPYFPSQQLGRADLYAAA